MCSLELALNRGGNLNSLSSTKERIVSLVSSSRIERVDLNSVFIDALHACSGGISSSRAEGKSNKGSHNDTGDNTSTNTNSEDSGTNTDVFGFTRAIIVFIIVGALSVVDIAINNSTVVLFGKVG